VSSFSLRAIPRLAGGGLRFGHLQALGHDWIAQYRRWVRLFDPGWPAAAAPPSEDPR